MAGDRIKHVTIIGVGLLGGSVALGLRRRYPRVRIAGVGRRESSLAEARKAGCIDSAHLDVTEIVSQSDLVVLATPVGAFEKYLRSIKPLLSKNALVTDVGSTKARVVSIAERILGKGGPFVGSHPMAGSENKGPRYASADLLCGALSIVTPTRNTPPSAVRRIEALWRAIGMRTTQMTPAAHDRTVARVSHLPHALAALLILLPTDTDIPVAAGGLRDTTRLAGGDPEMWRDIMTTNRKPVIDAIDKFSLSLGRLRELLLQDNERAIEKFFKKAKTRRDETLGQS